MITRINIQHNVVINEIKFYQILKPEAPLIHSTVEWIKKLLLQSPNVIPWFCRRYDS